MLEPLYGVNLVLKVSRLPNVLTVCWSISGGIQGPSEGRWVVSSSSFLLVLQCASFVPCCPQAIAQRNPLLGTLWPHELGSDELPRGSRYLIFEESGLKDHICIWYKDMI